MHWRRCSRLSCPGFGGGLAGLFGGREEWRQPRAGENSLLSRSPRRFVVPCQADRGDADERAGLTGMRVADRPLGRVFWGRCRRARPFPDAREVAHRGRRVRSVAGDAGRSAAGSGAGAARKGVPRDWRFEEPGAVISRGAERFRGRANRPPTPTTLKAAGRAGAARGGRPRAHRTALRALPLWPRWVLRKPDGRQGFILRLVGGLSGVQVAV